MGVQGEIQKVQVPKKKIRKAFLRESREQINRPEGGGLCTERESLLCYGYDQAAAIWLYVYLSAELFGKGAYPLAQVTGKAASAGDRHAGHFVRDPGGHTGMYRTEAV